MAIKKSELYSSLWASCDELHGGMDASQYKDYVLVLLFIKYISDKYAGVPFKLSCQLPMQLTSTASTRKACSSLCSDKKNSMTKHGLKISPVSTPWALPIGKPLPNKH
jgi:hypothetical protein